MGHPGWPHKQTFPGPRLLLSHRASGLSCSQALWLEPGLGRQCPRLSALPSGALGSVPCQSCSVLALPLPPWRDPSLYSGDSDIQWERLTHTAAPAPVAWEVGAEDPAMRTRTLHDGQWWPGGRHSCPGPAPARLGCGHPTAPGSTGQPAASESLACGLLCRERTDQAPWESPCFTAAIWQNFWLSSWAASC